MSEEADGIDWSGVSLDMVRQIHLQAETYLKAQLQVGLAADQRASTMSSIFAATAAALLALAFNYGTRSETVPIMSALIVTGAVLLIAAGCGAWSAQPVAFWYPGNIPANWYDCRDSPLVEVLGGEAENLNGHILKNARILKENQAWLRGALVLSVLAPIFGCIAWMFFR